jgi:hypothetical protein
MTATEGHSLALAGFLAAHAFEMSGEVLATGECPIRSGLGGCGRSLERTSLCPNIPANREFNRQFRKFCLEAGVFALKSGIISNGYG